MASPPPVAKAKVGGGTGFLGFLWVLIGFSGVFHGFSRVSMRVFDIKREKKDEKAMILGEFSIEFSIFEKGMAFG